MIPRISVVIPTYNRARLLAACLESLRAQSIGRNAFEVIVVDDGSTDDTAFICGQYASVLALTYVRLGHAGISAAKNIGLFSSRGPIILFFDDDDIAESDCLEQHLEAHDGYPEPNVAVLGYTTWAPSLTVSEVMHYVTDVGHFQFSYSNLQPGQVLDFTYFWGGRTSCKRSLLVKNGIFRQRFRFGSEDIELAYRLTAHDLKVVFNRNAVQYMNRGVTYDEFCHRCEKQGISQVVFARLHPAAVVQEYCQVIGAQERWETMRPELNDRVERVHEIEQRLASRRGSRQREALISKLWDLYRWTFNAFKTRGIVEAMQLDDSALMNTEVVRRTSAAGRSASGSERRSTIAVHPVPSKARLNRTSKKISATP